MGFGDIVKAPSSERGNLARAYLLGSNKPSLAAPLSREEKKSGKTLAPVGSLATLITLSQVPAVGEADNLVFADALKLISGEVIPSTMAGSDYTVGTVAPYTTVPAGSSAQMIAALVRSDKFAAQNIALGDLVHTATKEPGYIDDRVVAALYTIVFTWGYSIWVSTLRKGHYMQSASQKERGTYSHHTYGCAADIHRMNGVDMEGVLNFDPNSPPCALAVDMISDFKSTLVPDQILWAPAWLMGPVLQVQSEGKTVNVRSAIPLGGHKDHIHAGWAPGDRDIIPDSVADNVLSMTKEQAIAALASVSDSVGNTPGSTDVPATARIGVAIHYTGVGADQSAEEINNYHRSRYESNNNEFNPRGNWPLKYIGYNGVIRESGAWEDGRDTGVAGCHVKSSPGRYLGNNTDYLGICLGTVSDTVGPNQNQINMLVNRINAWKFQGGFTNIRLDDIKGHRDVPDQSTNCPGNALYATFGGSDIPILKDLLRQKAAESGNSW